MHIEQYLANKGVWFEVILHRPTYTAQATSRSIHMPSGEIAKGVLVKADDYVVAVVPANCQVDLAAIREALEADDCYLVHESELEQHFPDCEPGAVPPFGSLYGMQTLIDESLSRTPEITCIGNRHREALRLRYQDFHKLERPQVASIARSTEAAIGAHQ